MRKIVLLPLLVLLILPGLAQNTSKRYQFLERKNEADIPVDFIELSDGTTMLVWATWHLPGADTCFVRARKLLKSGVSGPIMTLDMFPAKTGSMIDVAPLSDKKFGMTYAIVSPGQKPGESTVVFSVFDSEGKKLVDRQKLGTTRNISRNHTCIDGDASGNYALGWEEFTDSIHSRFMLTVFTRQNTVLTAPFAFDDGNNLDCYGQQMEYNNGKIAVTMLRTSKADNYISYRVWMRTFSEKGAPLCPATLVDTNPFYGLGTRDLQLCIISNTEMAIGWTQASFDTKAPAGAKDSVQAYLAFYDLYGRKIDSTLVMPAHSAQTHSMHLGVNKSQLFMTWMDDADKNNGKLKACILDKNKKTIPDTVFIVEPMHKNTYRETVICRPTEKFRYFVINSQLSEGSAQQCSLVYSYHPWKEKKPKVKKEKEKKGKKEKDKKDKDKGKDEKPKDNSGRG